MVFCMWPFSSRKSERDRILESLLAADVKNRELEQAIRMKQSELEMRKLELEYEHLEAAHEEKRRDLKFKDEMRAAQRARAAGAREQKARKAQERAAHGNNQGCRVCSEPSYAGLTSEEILWHHNG